MNRTNVAIAFAFAALLAACAGRGTQSSTPTVMPPQSFSSSITAFTATPTPSPLPASRTIGGGGLAFGADDAFSPTDGNTATGGQGQTVQPADGHTFPCLTTMPNTYHVHAFVGIIINGRMVALPDGAGMKAPHTEGTFAGFTNWTEFATCFYFMHVHDSSDVVHIESNISASPETSLYNLGDFFAIWGRPLSTTQIGPFTGTVKAYVAQVPFETKQIQRTAYTLFSGNPSTIPLKSHTSIWLEIGPTFVAPSKFPVLNWYTAK